MKIVISIDLPRPEKDDDCIDIMEDPKHEKLEHELENRIPDDYLSKHWNKESKISPPSKLGKVDKPKKEKSDDKD